MNGNRSFLNKQVIIAEDLMRSHEDSLSDHGSGLIRIPFAKVPDIVHGLFANHDIPQWYSVGRQYRGLLPTFDSMMEDIALIGSRPDELADATRIVNIAVFAALNMQCVIHGLGS
jgi:hypothetical protein